MKRTKLNEGKQLFDKILKEMGPENDKRYIKYNQDLNTFYIGKMRNLLLQRTQMKSSNREDNQKESQKLTWMRLIKSRKTN